MELDNSRAYLDCTEKGPSDVAKFGSAVQSSPATAAVIVPVILSGGGGSRLWPFSTAEAPKQFLPLVGEKSLFRAALDRVGDRLHFSAPIVVGSVRHAELCESELAPDGDAARLVLEPCARNTAVAAAMAALVARETHGEGALLLVMPSDHVIEDVAAFHQAVQIGEQAARAGRLITFGIRPSGPDTGYGYLEMGEEVEGAPGVKAVKRFVEKPELAVAEQMVAGGKHLWNAGIFLFQAETVLEEMMEFAPDIGRAAIDAIDGAERSGIRIAPPSDALTDCVSLSIDYAVMEHSSRVAVVPMAPGWSDLGSWDALAEMTSGEEKIGPVTALDCEGCYVRSDGLEIAALGLRNLIIVASGQRLLILPRGRSQEVKTLLSAMDSKEAPR